MRKQTHFKKVVSFALAAAMAVSVCTAALADETTNEATKESVASEQIETKSADETNNKAVMLTGEANQPAGLADEGENEIAPQATNVAQIGDNTYDSVDAALNNAKSGDTVTLLSDATVSGRKFEETAITIDLQGHTLTLGGWLSSEINRNASLTIKNGKVVSTNRATGDKADLIITAGSSIAIDNVEVDTKGSFLYPCGDAAHVTVTNSTIRCGVYAVATNAATVDNYNIIIDLQDSTFESKYGYQSPADGDSCVICMNVPGVLNMKNCKVMGTRQGVFVRGGNATIEDSTITLTAVNDSSLYGTPEQYINSNWGGGDEVPMAALVVGNRVAENGSYKYPATCNLRNVTVTAPEGYKAVYTYGMNTDKSSNGRAVTLVYDEKTQFNGEFDVNNNVETVVLQKTETKPAEPETKVEGNVEDIKSENVDKTDVAGAAASTTITDSKDASASDVSDAVKNAATVKIGEEEVKLNDDKVVSAAKDAITEAAKDQSFDQDAATKDITIVAVPKLVVEPKAAANNDTDISMTFDIKMLYDVKATVADDVKNMTESNTVTLEKNKEMPAEQVPTVAISLDVSALKIPEGQKVFVRHVKENGEVYYYAADTTVKDGIVKTITFVNPDGFSEFTVMANKTVTLTIDGKEYALSAADIGKGFEIAKKDYCDWKGVSFKGIEGVYTTLTKELYDKAANGQKLEGTNVFEQVWFPPEEPTPAPTAAPTATPAPVEAAPVTTAAPTATPDDSQYYTCTACGHHNWTATADGYKCDTCGHLETKQISGYKNVKGTYTPTASSTKTAAATASTIPQTSDEMPIVTIAIIAIAALLGLGVTAYMKKKQN